MVIKNYSTEISGSHENFFIKKLAFIFHFSESLLIILSLNHNLFFKIRFLIKFYSQLIVLLFRFFKLCLYILQLFLIFQGFRFENFFFFLNLGISLDRVLIAKLIFFEEQLSQLATSNDDFLILYISHLRIELT